MPSAATTAPVATSPMPSTSRVVEVRSILMPVRALSSRTSVPAWRARSNSAASNSDRGTTAANWPEPAGSGNFAVQPEGACMTAPLTGCQLGIPPGSSPSRSQSLSASTVKPSPQHLSLGKVALSISTTERPAPASKVAAADPAGPPPTTATSTSIRTASTRWTRYRAGRHS